MALSENTDRSKEVCLAKLIFLGSPSAAVPSLDALVGAGHEVVLVVTREDKRRGRGNVPAPTPVKERAVELGLPVSHRLEDVLDVQADLGVVVAYGRIIPAALLQRLLFLNVHFSLLPRWRGAAPVERAILAGDRSSGVCIMRLAEGLDTGPLYACVEIAVDDDETCFALTDRLAHLGADLLTRLLSGNVAGLPEPVEQQGEPVYARKLEPGDLKIDWRSQSIAICRQVRLEKACYPDVRYVRARKGAIMSTNERHPATRHMAVDAVLIGGGAIVVIAAVLWIVNALAGILMFGVKVLLVVAVIAVVLRLVMHAKKKNA